ncbi:hypothetical protein L914_16642 [Phytophthora nicotianae]|uniref:BZIP domain-containing protein n=2 Tax=Phytophthora nicotianae TaxID=4792 RepID=V9ECG7_PHYNI|nr:hypothetical protein F443_17277 [Phytophthora nicotianae P1569]ETM36719.1 hypothetical protein L914_16642 [Phytophthora nicotianae]
MSFLEMTADDGMTVAEAIEFIDSFDEYFDDCEQKTERTNTGQTHSLSSSDSSIPIPTSNMVGEKRRTKKTNPPGYTTRVQRRKRAELQNLRDEAQELQERLDQLKKSTFNSHMEVANEDPAACQMKWRNLVETERNQRRHSEETNSKLKTILAHHLSANENLCRALHKKALLKGTDFVFSCEPTPGYSFAAFENNRAIVGHLEQLVGKLYLESGSLLDSWSSSSMNYSMNVQYDEQMHSKVAEMKATTPVACSMEVAADLMWREQSGQRSDPQKWAHIISGRQPNSQEKNWIFTLQCQSYIKRVNGVQLMQKFEDSNRIVFVRTDIMTLTTEGLRFRDQTWTIITRSDSDPHNASVVRIYEKLFMECQEGFSARPEDMAYAQNVVLKSLSWKLHNCTRQLQDTLVEKYEICVKSPLQPDIPGGR